MFNVIYLLDNIYLVPAELHVVRAFMIISVVTFLVACLFAVIAFIRSSPAMLCATAVTVLIEGIYNEYMLALY